MTRPTMDPAVVFREMTEADIPAGLALCRASGWNQVERDWRRFLACDPHGALVAVRDARVIGTVATMRYGQSTATGDGPAVATHVDLHANVRDRRRTTTRDGERACFAWVAMMLVDPTERGRGVGRALLTRALALLDNVDTIRLDATPAGEVLYRTLGFVEESRLSRLQRAATSRVASPWTDTSTGDATRVRPLAAADRDAVAALDARAFAADRRTMLEWLWQGAPGYAWVATVRDGVSERDIHGSAAPHDQLARRDPGAPQRSPSPQPSDARAEDRGAGAVGERAIGYVCGRRGYLFDHLGPVIADRAETAARLVSACLSAHPDRGFIVDAPLDQVEWRRWLTAAGFVEQRPFLRMSRGQPAPPGDPTTLFATLGPEFG